ncbi:hypothetical protein BKA67DRAFT_566738 [Truncatella angustata]|uniref:Secreted protein n=1 Tax=Truncatella angustata TaxID=152316 RepID=A0A9P8UI51_9PEZI|nr:uncharacterized protein BKA67DRAFT_566738 [Truncatella angustata]KAH6652505.1 hypothetical protein BKA67DRAFT_566738 [Truncatella angustata]
MPMESRRLFSGLAGLVLLLLVKLTAVATKSPTGGQRAVRHLVYSPMPSARTTAERNSLLNSNCFVTKIIARPKVRGGGVRVRVSLRWCREAHNCSVDFYVCAFAGKRGLTPYLLTQACTSTK